MQNENHGWEPNEETAVNTVFNATLMRLETAFNATFFLKAREDFF